MQQQPRGLKGGVSDSPDIGSSQLANGQRRIDDSRELIRRLFACAWEPVKRDEGFAITNLPLSR
jgi:hypothetical protein